jgi:small subunit ribosomal protein S20
VATRHASAMKAHRQTLQRTTHNRELRSKLRTALKSIRAAIDSGNTADAKAALSRTFSIVDNNAAGRYKSRIVKRMRTKTASA